MTIQQQQAERLTYFADKTRRHLMFDGPAPILSIQLVADCDAGAAALSRQREDANVAKARHAFSQELALTVLMLDSTDKMEAALRVLNPLLDALILAVQQSAALSQPSRQLEKDHGAGLIHQAIPDMAGTEPRLNKSEK